VLLVSQMFTLLAGDRADVANFAVLITDGASDNSLMTISEAFHAKRSNIHFIVVGVGKLINDGELFTLANYPYTVNYLFAADPNDLSNITVSALDLVCNSKSFIIEILSICLMLSSSHMSPNWLNSDYINVKIF